MQQYAKKLTYLIKYIGLGALISVSVTGCLKEKEDINIWIDQTNQSVRPKVEPLPPKVVYEPYQHVVNNLPNPFDVSRLYSDGRNASSDDAGKPDQNRVKQFLESIALSEMRMVGLMKNAQGATALVSAQGTVHFVKAGDYIGQDYGRVVNIQETGITLSEKIQDASGKWVDRETILPLSEKE